MKKLLTLLLCAIFSVCLCFAACGSKNNESDNKITQVSVYMPDGAPALALSPIMNESQVDGVNVSYNVVDSSLIQTYVTGENPAADICVLPVNLAAKLLGTGANYKLLGTLTHGNLYLLKKASGIDITNTNLSDLVGKTVGVINLAAVPGLTLKVILNDNNIPFNDLSTGSSVASDKVNLKAVTAEEVLPSDSTCDYFVVPEPAATTKVTKTNGKLAFAGDLQTLYGGEEGYPQAVVVAKNSVIENASSFVTTYMQSVKSCDENITSGNFTFEQAVEAINSKITAGSTSSLNVNNLNMQVYQHCAINFTEATSCKQQIIDFINKLINVNASSAAAVSDAFFYGE